MVLSTEEKVFLVEHYFRSYGMGRHNGASLLYVSDQFTQRFNKRSPSNAVILKVIEKFRNTGSVLCQRKGNSGRPRTVNNNNNHERVFEQILQNPKASQARTALQLDLKRTSFQRILKELGAFSYVIQVHQQLHPRDYRSRVEYCARILALQYENPEFLKNVWFSDEAHFHLSGYVNRRTNRFLGFARPDEVQEVPLHSAKVSVWCAVSGHGIIGPYFIEENGRQVTLNQQRYRHILTRFIPDLRQFCRARNLAFRNQFFQQDGATCHTAAAIRQFLQEHFPSKFISRFTDFPYPSHSPDLTPPDAYIWGMAKNAVFKRAPQTIDELKDAVRVFFAALRQPLFNNMTRYLEHRYEVCLERGGAHLEHIIKCQ